MARLGRAFPARPIIFVPRAGEISVTIIGVTASASADGLVGVVAAQNMVTVIGVTATAGADGLIGTISALLGRVLLHFRFRNDDGSEATATWAQAEDVDHAEGTGVNARLRTLVDTNIDTPSEAIKLQVRRVGDTDWKDVQP